MKARSIIVYSVLRLLAFLVPLGIMMLIPIFHELYWFAIGFSAIIGISLSMIFLSGPRDEVAKGIAARRKARRPKVTVEDEDEVVENAANDMVRDVPVDDDAAADIAAAGESSQPSAESARTHVDPTTRPAADAS